MSKIPLKNKLGEIIEYALVDKNDFERVNDIRWYLGDGYASSKIGGRMHRFILNTKKGDPIVDHINNNRLDNRKINLRFTTYSQNNQNKSKKNGCSSIYIGVCYRKSTEKWICKINRVSKSFKIEEHAAYWYDQLALKYYGTNAKINGINKPDDFIEPIEKKERDLPKGVYLTPNGKYAIKINDKHIGTASSIEEAEQTYINKKEELNLKKEHNIISQEIIRNEDNIAIIKISSGEEILVDDDKYYDLIKYTWSITKGYALNCKENMLMHRFLMNAQKGDVIDHINNNRLDNRLINLRQSNNSLNSHNISKQKNTSSKYIGVCYHKKTKKYQAGIKKDDKRYYLGLFNTEEDAARARDKKALELYGEFVKLNYT